jgi:hypothetical protein
MRKPLIILATAAALLPGAALAQLIPPAGQVGPKQNVNVNNKPPPAPPALPGAQSSGPIVGAERAARNLAPNAALFDAIDRGDLAAAREALGRGADVNSRNALGETALDLSVDLARNDITFLLLSARNGEPAPGAAPLGANPIRQVAANTTGPARSAQTGRPAPAARPATRTATPVRPVTLSTDPGTPNPSAGFLGFGPVQH